MDTILLTGKTDLFPLESLKYIGEMFHVLVTGRLVKNREKNLPAGVRALPVEPSDSDFQKVFEIGSIKAVWHIGSCADGGHISDETADIEKILNCCARYGIPRLVVLTEPGDPVNYRKLISKWTIPGPGASPVDIAAVYLPLITGSGSRGRTNRIFSAMRRSAWPATMAITGQSATFQAAAIFRVPHSLCKVSTMYRCIRTSLTACAAR